MLEGPGSQPASGADQGAGTGANEVAAADSAFICARRNA
jgi:hypothetical protein